MATMLCSKVAFQNFKGLQSPGQASILGHLSFPTRSYDDMYFVEVFKVGHGECRTWPVGTPVGTLVGTILFAGQVNEGERSVVSMRDIGRAARVFKWFLGGRCQSWAVLSTFFF